MVPLGQKPGHKPELSAEEMETFDPGVDPASGDEVADEVADEDAGGGDRGLLWVAGELGRGAASMMFEAATGGAEAVWSIGSSLTRQIPRLARLEGLRRNTRIGIALTLAEQAETSADGTFFLYEGRAHSFADADRRVDAIVRGLLQIGVRAGEHVGVLMHTRPTALALVAAINRLGAVAVLLRGDADLRDAIAIGGVEHLVSDPDHAADARGVWPKTVYVLGGVHAPGRALPEGAVDMERIDPARVAVPDWYTPSPGRAEDVAFVFFAGRGAALRANRITNGRWALSAYGTASAAALSQADTVYSWAPIQHPTGLLVSHSAALAAGSRLAMARGFSARTFWDEVRRYGASVVFYTGIMLRELVDAAHDAAERKHPLRMFAGSGMPKPLWQKVVDRFGPVDVLEFYASTEGNAILANVSGKRIGSVGRPLPGSAEVRLAAWNVEENTPVFTPFGYVRPAERGEIGMMLARVERERGALAGKPLRNVFEKGDAWTATRSLFTQDARGDFWLVDHRSDMIRAAAGWLPSIAIDDAVWEVHGVSAAAAFGLTIEGAAGEIPAVAIAMRAGYQLEPDALARKVVEKLGSASRPRVVRLMNELPVTAGDRVLKSALRSQGIPAGYVEAGRILVWNAAGRRYEKLESTADLRERILAG